MSTKPTRVLKDNSGLTLIEIIAAVGILAVGLIAILSLFPVGLKSAQEATNVTRATLIGQSMIEEIRMKVAMQSSYDHDDIENEYATNGVVTFQEFSDDPPISFDDSIRDDYYQFQIFAPEEALYNEDDLNTTIPGLYKITIKVYWFTPSMRRREKIFVTLIKER
jgi:type IV pilus modification protein PilV